MRSQRHKNALVIFSILETVYNSQKSGLAQRTTVHLSYKEWFSTKITIPNLLTFRQSGYMPVFIPTCELPDGCDSLRYVCLHDFKHILGQHPIREIMKLRLVDIHVIHAAIEHTQTTILAFPSLLKGSTSLRCSIKLPSQHLSIWDMSSDTPDAHHSLQSHNSNLVISLEDYFDN